MQEGGGLVGGVQVVGAQVIHTHTATQIFADN